MALTAGVPVIPVAMLNADEIQPTGKIIPKIMRARIRFGPPLDFSRYAGMAGDRFVERTVTDEIMYELMAALRPRVRRRLRAKVKEAAAAAARSPPQPARLPTPSPPDPRFCASERGRDAVAAGERGQFVARGAGPGHRGPDVGATATSATSRRARTAPPRASIRSVALPTPAYRSAASRWCSAARA